MDERIERKIKVGTLQIDGVWPIVVLGPNGSGKSRLGTSIVEGNQNSERISAKRMVVPPDQLHFQSEQQVANEYRNQKNQFRSQIYQYASEFESLIFKLFAEDATSAISYRDEAHKQLSNPPKPEVTKFNKIQHVWRGVFPGREIAIRKSGLRVEASHLSKEKVEYSASQMSDGELVAFYMISRVVDADPGILIVDEPELHLHPLLARTLWNALEDFRKDLRLVYITHDFQFAESRRNANFVVVRPGKEPELINDAASLPPEIFSFLLGAASGSVKSDRVVFCEGEPGGLDEQIYRAWVSDANVSVQAVGGCTSVLSCYEAVKSGRLLAQLTPIAIIDRDDKCNEELDHLRKRGIQVASVSEIEALLVVKPVFEAVAKQLLIADFEKKYSDFLEAAMKLARPNLNARVLERSKRKSEWVLRSALHRVSCDATIEQVKLNFVEHCQKISNEISPEAIFQSETETVSNALEKRETFFEIMPGKIYWRVAAEKLGVTPDRYLEIFIKLLLPDIVDSAELKTAKEALRRDLAIYFPSI